jgi:glycosyltransferase involved in cell wall biosynthesis
MKYIGIDFREIGEKETGIGNYTKSIASEIIKQDKNNIYYFIFNRNSIYERYKLIYKKNKNIKVVAIKSRTKSIFSEFSLQKELNRLKLDIFWTHIWGSIYFMKTPYIISLHDIIGVKNPQYISLKYRIYNTLHLKWTLNKSLKIFVPTKAVKEDIINYIKIKNIKKIKITGEGVTIPKTYYEGEDILNKYKITEKFYIYIGNSRPHKNINTLIDAFLEYKKKYNKKINLVLLGVTKEDIKKSDKDIIILENIDNVEKFEILKKALCFITLTFDEGFSLPCIESANNNTPIICSDIPVLREVVGDEGALFVDNENIDEIIEAMNLIYNNEDLRKRLTENALIHTEKYSWKKTAKKVLKYIK